MKKFSTSVILLVFLLITTSAFADIRMTVEVDSSGNLVNSGGIDLSNASCISGTTEGICCWNDATDKLYCGTGAAAQEIGSSASMAVGSPVTSGTTGSALYIDAAGNLGQENATFNYSAATNTFTAEIITTTGSDPKVTVPNADGPAAVADGDIWTATDVDAVGISDGTNKYYARPTKLKTCNGNCSPAVTELDAMIWVTATGKVSLPAVAANIYGASVCVYSTTAAAVRVDVDALDRIVLNGLALGDGNCILNNSLAGSFVCLIADSVAGWTTLGRSGVWTDDAAN